MNDPIVREEVFLPLERLPCSSLTSASVAVIILLLAGAGGLLLSAEDSYTAGILADSFPLPTRTPAP